MPGSYPPAPGTLSGDLFTISRFLQNPTMIKRRLRELTDLRFVSDQILTQKLKSQGGAVLYEVSEPIVNTRPIEPVAPGAEYPRDTVQNGTAATAAVSNWGEAVFLSDAKIKRSVYGGTEVDRSLRKVSNTVISKVDKLTVAAVASAVTATSASIGSWSGNTAAIYRDIEIGAGKVVDLNQGYRPDSVLMSTTKYALMITDQIIAALRKREASDNPVYGGSIESIGNYKVVYTASSNLPSDDVWVYDSTQLGGMADENEVDPGYVVADNGLHVKNMRIDNRDGWDLWARRITVPVVQEPASAIKITGTT